MNSSSTLPARRRALAIAVAAIVASGIASAEPAKVLKSTELRATPAPTADVLAKLEKDQTVDITARQGAWASVTNAAGVAGWARILNLRSAAAGGGDGGRADFGALFATGSTGATSTTGAKGLNGNDLMKASPDMAGVAALDGFASTAGDAQSFAAQAPVSARQVPYLPEPRGGRRNR